MHAKCLVWEQLPRQSAVATAQLGHEGDVMTSMSTALIVVGHSVNSRAEKQQNVS